MLKDRLQIILITYNRKFFLDRTLQQIFLEDSPIKDFDITILDNDSTDGTKELVKSYSEKHNNLKYIKNPLNVGGNANITKAFEYASSAGKEYFWVICDDDKFDFSNWKEVEDNIEKGADIICLSNYSIHNEKNEFITNEEKLFQMAFVPAGIFKTELLDSSILTNMYNSISDSFPQLCPTIHAINQNKNITVLSKPIVYNGIHCVNKCKNVSLTRGTCHREITQRHKHATWILGFSNVIRMLSNKNLQTKAMIYAIKSDEIYGNWDRFFYHIYKAYCQQGLFDYAFEILSPFPKNIKLKFVLKCLWWKITGRMYFERLNYYKTLKKVRRKKLPPENKEFWINYLKKQNTQKYIDKIAKKYKNKKILLYGNGIISKVLQENYDLSELNIVAITDRLFLGCDGPKEHKYKIIPPNRLGSMEFDAVLVAMKRSGFFKQCLKDNGYKQPVIPITKKETPYVGK